MKKNKMPISKTHKKLIETEWNYEKNNKLKLYPTKLTYGSQKKVWWICIKGHEWEATIWHRCAKGRGCPYCCGKKVCKNNCLSTTNPELIKEWNYKKNNKLGICPTNITHGSDKKVWWKCDKGHEWKTTCYSRISYSTTKGTGCPYCAGQKACKDNCLSTTNPELIKEWNYKKNNKLEIYPTNITYGSGKKVWWKCNKGHEWKASCLNRRETGCPYCAGRKVCKDNCLSTTHPELTKKWHPTKNGKLTPNDVTVGSHKKVWWKCNKGHEWKTPVYQKGKCLKCAIINVTGKNNPRYNFNLSNEDRIDRRKIPENREWRKSVYTRDDYTCQICNKKRVNLNAHHLMGYNKYPKLRFKINNGITLCTDCHKDFHNIYGRGNNTTKQFEEYIKHKNNNILIISA